jgi:hypothetical protein
MKEFPDFDIEAAARRKNEDNRKEDELITARRLAAQEEARRIAAVLRAKDSSIRLIWGFGSVFEVDLIDISDCDDQFAQGVRERRTLL